MKNTNGGYRRKACFLLKIYALLVIGSIKVVGQIDELKKELANRHLKPSEKVKIYDQLSRAYWGEQWDSAAYYAQKAFDLAAEIDDSHALANASVKKAVVSAEAGNIEEAFEYFAKAEHLSKQHQYKEVIAEIYDHLGILFQQQNQIDSAAHYYRKSIQLCEELGLENHVLRIKNNLGYILKRQNKHQELAMMYDSIIPQLEQKRSYTNLARTYSYMSLNFKDMYEKEKALLYTQKAIQLVDSVAHKETQALIYYNAGGTYLHYKEYPKAEELLHKSLQLVKETNDPLKVETVQANLAEVFIVLYNDYTRAEEIVNQTIQTTVNPHVLRLKGQIEAQKNQFKVADQYLTRALAIYEQRRDESSMRLIWQLKLRNQLESIGDQSLMHAFEAYDSLNTTVNESENKRQFIQMETKFRTAEKEAEIQRKELALKSSQNRLLLLSGVLVMLVMGGGFTFWTMKNYQRRKALQYDNELLVLQNTLTSVELANLNNQLNPHEVKNLLTSIAPDLIRKAPEVYRKMIKLFNITKASLNQQLTESLLVQLTQIDDYLSLQQSISPYQWEYVIENNLIQTDGLEIPRLLLKNMVENAVKHGINSQKEEGMIKVIIEQIDDKYRQIMVMDNGHLIAQSKENSTGIGLATYQKLFAFTNEFNKLPASISLERAADWTQVCIRIPLHYKYSKSA